MEKKSIFQEFREINVNEHVEKKGGLSYLTWAWAFDELFKRYPSAKYEIKWFDGKPYLYDPVAGYMVFTSITVKGQTKEMWLPVINYDYMPMKDKPYQYTFRKWNKKMNKYDLVSKTCDAIDMFEINKTIMRCLVKNIAMFGLGLYLFAGEDEPYSDEEDHMVNRDNELPDTEQTAQLLSLVAQNRTRLTELGVDVKEDSTNAKILEKAKVKTQDLGCITTTRDLIRLNMVYCEMIKELENKNE